jgi:transcriptional regulator with XRE-family HTH domain
MYDLIGRGVARARQEKGWTQEQTARVFRAHGLNAWRKGTVGQLEAGLRRPRLDEVLLMARALDVGVDQLIPGGDNERVVLGDDAKVSPRWIREMLTGEFFRDLDRRPATDMPHEHFPIDDVLAEMRKRARAEEEREEPFVTAIADWDERHGDKLMGTDLLAMHERPSDAERHAARRLGVEPPELKVASRALWDRRDFDDERDRRVGDVDQLEPRSRQARRGLVTREMLAELRTFFEEIRQIIAEQERDSTNER